MSSNQLRSVLGNLLPFDRKEYPLDELFLNEINVHLGKSAKKVSSLDLLHEAVGAADLAEVYARCYDLMDQDVFLEKYRGLIREVIAPHIKVPIIYQKKPGIRIHLPKTQTVQYHTDEWYGHGPEVINCWLPLTPSFESNSLHAASLQESIIEVKRLEKEKASMSVINDSLRAISKPITTECGNIYIFNAQTVHGSETNLTKRTRVSLDCRLLIKGGDAGRKNIVEYYEDPSLKVTEANTAGAIEKPRNYTAVSYIYSAHGFTRFVSPFNQRIICKQYAKDKGINIVAEETEIRTMSHHPTLLGLAGCEGTHSFDSVLLYSIFCLPQAREDREKIYKMARTKGAVLFFANEQLVFPLISKEAEIEQRMAESSSTSLAV